MAASDAQAIERRIRSMLPALKSGSLRIWGQWFGRPYDSFHRIVGAESTTDRVVISFDEGEALTAWNPRRFKIGARAFRIRGADRVRWEWFYYGRPKTPENRYYEDYVKEGEVIKATTNADWYVADLRPDARMHAVEIL